MYMYIYVYIYIYTFQDCYLIVFEPRSSLVISTHKVPFALESFLCGLNAMASFQLC